MCFYVYMYVCMYYICASITFIDEVLHSYLGENNNYNDNNPLLYINLPADTFFFTVWWNVKKKKKIDKIFETLP